jgi:hypothetical protein
MKMKGSKLFQILVIFIFTIFLLLGTALAEPMTDPPTFIYSSFVDSASYSPGNLEFKNYLVFDGRFSVGPDTSRLDNLPNAGVRNYTDGPKLFWGGYTGDTAWNKVRLYADPSKLEARLLNDAWSKDGASSFVNNASGAVKWFVLKGAKSPVNLRADLLFQANMFGGSGQGGTAQATFIHFLIFTPSPSATSRFRPLVISGASGGICEPVGYVLTSPGFCYSPDGQPHIINNAIRSNPFTVMPDTPFQLQLSLNGSAFTASVAGIQSRATANFYDPKLATSFDFPDIPQLTPEGFVVDLDGNPATQDVATLSSLNYKVLPITMPSISSVDPNHGADLKPATLTITGDGFMEGAQVKLIRAGEPDIVGNALVTKKKITATFDLAGKTQGSWDIVVTNLPVYPELSVTLPAAFTIEEGIPPQVWMDIVGRTVVSTWGAQLSILIGNRGNVEAVGSPIIHGIPKECRWYLYGLPAGQTPIAMSTETETILLLPGMVVPPDAVVKLDLWIEGYETTIHFDLTAVWED